MSITCSTGQKEWHRSVKDMVSAGQTRTDAAREAVHSRVVVLDTISEGDGHFRCLCV